MELPVRTLSHAVLIGTSTFDHLPDLPAVRNNLVDLRAELTHPEHGILAPANCEIVDSPDTPQAFMSRLRHIAARTDDVLLVYYAGHGIRHETRDTLYLTLRRTEEDALDGTAVPFDWVKDVVGASPARTRVLVLDCCYSGMALGVMSGTSLSEIEVRGTAVLASSPRNRISHSPTGARNTAFTAKMLDLLRRGSPIRHESLTVLVLYKRIYAALAREDLPRPLLKVTDTSGDLLVRRPTPRRQPTGKPKRPTPSTPPTALPAGSPSPAPATPEPRSPVPRSSESATPTPRPSAEPRSSEPPASTPRPSEPVAPVRWSTEPAGPTPRPSEPAAPVRWSSKPPASAPHSSESAPRPSEPPASATHSSAPATPASRSPEPAAAIPRSPLHPTSPIPPSASIPADSAESSIPPPAHSPDVPTGLPKPGTVDRPRTRMHHPPPPASSGPGALVLRARVVALTILAVLSAFFTAVGLSGLLALLFSPLDDQRNAYTTALLVGLIALPVGAVALLLRAHWRPDRVLYGPPPLAASRGGQWIVAFVFAGCLSLIPIVLLTTSWVAADLWDVMPIVVLLAEGAVGCGYLLSERPRKIWR